MYFFKYSLLALTLTYFSVNEDEYAVDILAKIKERVEELDDNVSTRFTTIPQYLWFTKTLQYRQMILMNYVQE